jgi:hypothetical protein
MKMHGKNLNLINFIIMWKVLKNIDEAMNEMEIGEVLYVLCNRDTPYKIVRVNKKIYKKYKDKNGKEWISYHDNDWKVYGSKGLIKLRDDNLFLRDSFLVDLSMEGEVITEKEFNVQMKIQRYLELIDNISKKYSADSELSKKDFKKKKFYEQKLYKLSKGGPVEYSSVDSLNKEYWKELRRS